jgi:hypothetical protein
MDMLGCREHATKRHLLLMLQANQGMASPLGRPGGPRSACGPPLAPKSCLRTSSPT